MLKFDPILAASSNFHAGEGPPAGMRPGPCAMGPSPEHEPASMHVWVFQHVRGGLALASGDTRQDPMFASTQGPRWRVPTALDPDSKEFELDKPAVALAIALLDNGADILEWSQAVTIATESPFPGRAPG